MTKLIICDSSSLISLSMNGLLDVITKLKEKFNINFIITKEVQYETISNPLSIKRFELEALRIKDMLEKKILQTPEEVGFKSSIITEKMSKILNLANNSYYARGQFTHLIDKGEASCLALSLLASEDKIENVILVDERTTRMMGESPENLRKLLSNKIHDKVDIRKQIQFIKNIKFIRSAEILYIAYKNNILEIKNPSILDAVLYAVKFKGCSISFEEIEEMKRLAK